jgi:glucose/arabinose dehydrogenase
VTGPCANRDPALTLPDGFCAQIFADNVGAPRHVVVAPTGEVFVALAGGSATFAGLRDNNGDGRADTVERAGAGGGGTGIGLHDGFLYVEQNGQIARYGMPPRALRPFGNAQSVLTGLPTGGHGARNFVIDPQGRLYVNVGSATNACQQNDRVLRSPGVDPCPELNTRGGIWRFNANALGQSFSVAGRFATGLRNSEGLAFSADGSLWAAVHGRDQLADNWPALFTADYSAENPGEALVRVEEGDDFGWPYCYHSMAEQKLVLAPEYGGDGTKTQRCDQKTPAVAAMPGHWAPMSILFYTGSAFPAKYRDGVFIAFHGSWNRAPRPQAGFRVVFVPLANGRQSGEFETFADGFAGGNLDPDRAAHRPMGLAQGPSGEIYITDDKGGRIWRVTYSP